MSVPGVNSVVLTPCPVSVDSGVDAHVVVKPNVAKVVSLKSRKHVVQMRQRSSLLSKASGLKRAFEETGFRGTGKMLLSNPNRKKWEVRVRENAWKFIPEVPRDESDRIQFLGTVLFERKLLVWRNQGITKGRAHDTRRFRQRGGLLYRWQWKIRAENKGKPVLSDWPEDEKHRWLNITCSCARSWSGRKSSSCLPALIRICVWTI